MPYVTRPFGTRFAVRTDRSPDYSALARLAGDPLHLVAEREGRVVGTICAIRVAGGWGAERLPTSLFLDLRLRPEERSRTSAYRLTQALFRAEAERGTAVCLGVVLANAPEVRTLLSKERPAGIPSNIVGRYVSYAILPRRIGQPPAGVDVSVGRPDDLPAIRDLLRAQHRGWSLAPDFDRWSFEGLSPGAFYVGRTGGRLAACVALHDLSPHRRLVVEAFGPVLGGALAAIRPWAALLGHALPRRREPVRAVALRHLAVAEGADGLAAGAAVVAAAAAAARARRAHVMTLGLPAGDRRTALVRPYPRDPTPYDLHAARLAPDASISPAPLPGPIYLDLALI